MKGQADTTDSGNEIDFILSDNTTHKYYFKDNNLYFIVLDSDGNTEKYITLCKEIENCEFSYKDNKLKSVITIQGLPYTNVFNI